MLALVRTCGITTSALGLGLAVWGVMSSFGPGPLPLAIALFIAGLVFLSLGVGLVKRSRTAWSFTVSALGVVSVAGLLAVPALVRGGLPSPAAGVLLAVVLGLLGAVIAAREAF